MKTHWMLVFIGIGILGWFEYRVQTSKANPCMQDLDTLVECVLKGKL